MQRSMKQNPVASKSCHLRSLGQTAVNDPNEVGTHHGKQTGLTLQSMRTQ